MSFDFLHNFFPKHCEELCEIWPKMYIGFLCKFVHALLYMRTEENQLDATEWFIAHVICPTCFGHVYAHHQEIETILVFLPHMVCNVLVTGGCRSGAGQQAMRPGSYPHPGHIACCPAPDRRSPTTKTLHTIYGNNTSIVSISWWWANTFPKHAEQITCAINHSVASSWFSSLRMCIGLHAKYQFLSDFNETWIFSTSFSKSTQISNFIKIRPVGAELFYADKHDEAYSRFSQFCERA